MRKGLWQSKRQFSIDECRGIYNRIIGNIDNAWHCYIGLPILTTTINNWQIVPVLVHHTGSSVHYMQYVLVLELEENE